MYETARVEAFHHFNSILTQRKENYDFIFIRMDIVLVLLVSIQDCNSIQHGPNHYDNADV